MYLSIIIALAGASLCLAQTASDSLTSNNPTLGYLEPRDNKQHHKMHNKMNNHPLHKRESMSLDKRSAKSDYDRAIRYMNKAKKSYERAQRKHDGSRRTSRSKSRKSRPSKYLQNPNSESSRSRHGRPDRYDDNTRYDQSLDYTTGYNENSMGYDDYNTGYGGSFESPPSPPTGLSPPSPFGGGTIGSGGTGGKDGSASEIEAWGLKDGKIPEGADIEEEDKPDPEQDPSDNDDPPIVDGKPVAREE